MPGPVFQIVSLGAPSICFSTRRRPAGACRAASSAFIISSRIIAVLGHLSIKLAMRKGSSVTSRAATAFVLMTTSQLELAAAFARRRLKATLDLSDCVLQRADDLTHLVILKMVDLSVR